MDELDVQTRPMFVRNLEVLRVELDVQTHTMFAHQIQMISDGLRCLV